VRDPLGVCSELIRVSKAGYIEVPSRLLETCRGLEHPRIAGLSHHRWLVESSGNHLQFTQKYHCIHAEFDLSLPAAFARTITPPDRIVQLFWEGGFTFSETLIHGNDVIYPSLADFVRLHYQYPLIRHRWKSTGRFVRRTGRLVKRGVNRIARAVGVK
jgi:hypothetical protein